MKESFRKIATKISALAGSAWMFCLAVVIVCVWAASGPLFDFSDTWQLIINTGTTIATFLMVFLIQNTQNRDGRAMQIKLDELIRATRAKDSYINIEDLSDDEIAALSAKFKRMHEQEQGHSQTGAHKLHGKFEDILTKRRTLPGAEQVVELINPFANHSDSDKKSAKK